MSVPVVLAAPGLPGETELVAALARPGAEVTVVRRCVDAIDLIGAAASGCAHAAVVSPNLPRLGRETVARLHASHVGVLGVVAAGDDAGERTLRDLDVHRVIVMSPEDLQRSLGQLARAVKDPQLARPGALGEAAFGVPAVGSGAGFAEDSFHAGMGSCDSEPESFHRGALIAVWGSHGAPGATSLAITMSDEIARAGRPCLLVDADTLGGSTATALGILDEASGLAVACRHADAGTLDALSLAQSARSLRDGWRILTGIARSERWVELRPAALSRLWQVCRDMPGVTIVDIGSGIESPQWSSHHDRFAAAHTCLEAADAVIAVGSGDPVGMERLIHGLELLRERCEVTPRVVINRVRRSVLGRDPQGQIRETLVRHSGVTDVTFIDDDPSSFDAALREGGTLAEVAGRSQARAILRDLARDVLQGAESAVKA